MSDKDNPGDADFGIPSFNDREKAAQDEPSRPSEGNVVSIRFHREGATLVSAFADLEKP